MRAFLTAWVIGRGELLPRSREMGVRPLPIDLVQLACTVQLQG